MALDRKLVSMAAWFAPVAVIVACGGATAQDVDGLPAEGGADSGSTTNNPEAAAAKDTGTTKDATATTNPKSVTCGADECPRSGDGKSREICCVKPGAPPEMACARELDPDACKEARRECDDAADCDAGQVCCAETNSGRMNTVCMATCITGAPRWQVCKTSAECEGGIPCTTGICPKQGVYGFCVGAAIPDGCR